MLGQSRFQELMQELVVQEKERRSIRVTGRTLDIALKEAALELSLPISRLEYEILERGRVGFLGIGRRNFILEVSEYNDYHIEESQEKVFEGEEEEEKGFQEEVRTDGTFYVRLFEDGAYLKVNPPHNGGLPVDKKDILNTLDWRGVLSVDSDAVTRGIKEMKEEFLKVGEFVHNPLNDAVPSVEVSNDDMEAYLEVRPPRAGGADLSSSTLLAFLKNNHILYGVIEEALIAFEENPQYGKPYLIAKGSLPKNGANASLQYLFDHDNSHTRVKQNADGSVDFKELDIIKSVVKGQPLAQKIPPTKGESGWTVFNEELPAIDGEDLILDLGENVTLAKNGRTIIATANGQALYVQGKIFVEGVLVISGDVNANTGNIKSLGSVVINGNVEDGFKVSSQGSIEVNGYVGKAMLQSGLDIVVKKGINGDERETSRIIAGKTLWASFINNARIDAGKHVIVSDGIVNADIHAQGRVLCKGKRARIVGGTVQATSEINAASFGSEGGVETILQVGYDPRLKEEVDKLHVRLEDLKEELSEAEYGITLLLKQKKRTRKLSKEKEAEFLALRKKRNELNEEELRAKEELMNKEQFMNSLVKYGNISASQSVHTGVQVRILEEVYEVTTPFEQPISFYIDSGFISTRDYDEIPDEAFQRDENNVN